jgi:hypothetical protein
MSRHTVWAAGIVSSAAVLFVFGGGCDSPREIQEAKPVGNGETKPPILTADKAPDKSDPAALAVVKDAILGHTGGKPELLQTLRNTTFKRSGHAVGGGGGQLKQSWTVHAGWPDRFRVKMELEGPIVLTLAWGPGGGWQHQAGQEKIFLPAQGVRDFKIDVTGEWLGLIFPLAEPGLIVAPAPDQTFNNRLATGIRVWHPELSDAVVHFDKESKLLAGITYDGRESGRKVTKEVTVLSVRLYSGIQLPERIVVRSNNNVLFEWTMTSLDPMPNLDSNLFVDP